LGVVDHRDADAVLDRPAGIRALQLEPHLASRELRIKSVQANMRRVADRLEDVVDAHGSESSGEKWLMRPWKLFGPGARGKLGLYPCARGKVRGRAAFSPRGLPTG